MIKRRPSDANIPDYEIYFLITKFLEAGPCSQAAEVLKQELHKHEIIPKMNDWEGCQHDQSFEQFESKFRHIGPKHLVQICERFGPLLDKEIPPSTAGLSSLLGIGRQSIMRTTKDPPRTWRSLLECIYRRHQMPLVESTFRTNCNIANVLLGRELSGPFSRKHAFPPKTYSKLQLLSRTLGHLSPVYCCLFDRTGKFAMTGADDNLIKVWSAIDGRLLATIRGVLSEITDISINQENTLLAAGSVDKIVRVWSLHNAYPVAVLIAHTGIITCVNFCPGVFNGTHYLASTSTDGSVAFWSYTEGPDGVDFLPKALQYNERMRPGQAQMICASFSPGGMFMAAGSADHHVRVYKMYGENIDGPHRILETELHTDRVDSIQWAHSGLKFISGSKDGTAIIWRFTRQRWKTLLLNMSTKLNRKSEESVDPKLKLKVIMVSWSSNDKWAITSCNDHSIKVWESASGQLYEVLKGHSNEVFVLESHPLDPNVLLSAGHDGLILLWDVQIGTQLVSFQNKIELYGCVSIFDAKWSPDGTMIVASDLHGHILLFSLGFISDKIKKLPKEMFFHTDYRPLTRDSSYNVLDEQTQIPPHLMPPPFLVDIDGNPYPPYLQRLVPGRENCHSHQLVPNIIMSPGGQQEVIEGLNEPRSHIDEMIQALANRSGVRDAQQNGLPASPSMQNQRSPLSPRPARRSRGDVEGVRQSIGNWQKDEFSYTHRHVVKPLEKYVLKTIQDQIETLGKLELEEYKFEMQRAMEFKPAPMSSQEFAKKKQMRKKQTHAYRTRGSRVEQLQNQFENSDGLGGSVSADSDSSNNDSTARSEDLDSSSSESSSSEYSDWIAEHGLEPPKRIKRQFKRRAKPTIVKKQNVEVPEVYRPSEWLSEVIPKKFPYYPQMGDELMFFKEGYYLYLDAVRKRGVYTLQNSQVTPWGKINIKEPELVKIIGIKYELRPPRLCCLRLAVMKQNGKLTGDRFSIKYHDVPDVIDFLVLRQTYDTAMQRNWDIGDRFRSMIDDCWWWGTILSRREDAQSEFLSYFIRWDNAEEEKMSPWDMEPVDQDRLPAEEGGSLPVLPEEINAILYHPKPDEWPGGNRDLACDRILRGLDDIMGLSVAEPFIAPVDINQYPSYAYIVEYPIDLSTIKSRFENRFYRRVTAAQFDVRYLATNAEKFNEDSSPIVRHARVVTDLCLKVISELSDVDVPVVYRQFMESYKTESSDEAAITDTDAPGPSTSKRSSSGRLLRTASRLSKKNHKLQNTSDNFDWRRACQELLDTLLASRDSEPFREPVDRLEHPDYDQIIITPMDLWTVREELRGDNYASIKEFWKDLKLIFKNSKTYSPDPRSRIYSMTTRLNSLAERLMKHVNDNHKAFSRRQKRELNKTKIRKSERGRKLNSRYAQNGMITDDSDCEEDENMKNNKDDSLDEFDHEYRCNTRKNNSATDKYGGASTSGVMMKRKPPAISQIKSRFKQPVSVEHRLNDSSSDDDLLIKRSVKSVVGGRMKTREVKKGVNYTMSTTDSEDDSLPLQSNSKPVNGYPRKSRELIRRKKHINPNSDEDENELIRNVRRKKQPLSNHTFSNTNDHTYHTSPVKRNQTRSPRSGVTSLDYIPSRKRRKQRSESESDHSPQPSTSFGRPRRSVKRKNYAAMIDGNEENSLDNDDVDENEPTTFNNQKRNFKNNYPESQNKKSFKTRSVNINITNVNSNINEVSNSVKNNRHYSTRRAFLNLDKTKNVGGRSIRSLNKKINYYEERSESNNDNDNLSDENQENEDYVKNKSNVSSSSVTNNVLLPKKKGRKPNNQKASTSNGYSQPGCSKDAVKSSENILSGEETDDHPLQSFRTNRKKAVKKEEFMVEFETEEEMAGDDDDDENDEDFNIRNRSLNRNKPTSKRSSGGSDLSRNQNRSFRNKRKRTISDSDYDNNRASIRTNCKKLDNSNRLRRSKRPHQPLKNDSDSFGSEISDDGANSRRLSISSRGRVRKISPRVRAFLGD